MPSRLPVQDIFAGLVTSVGTAVRYWFHYTLVAFAWLGVVPLTACKSILYVKLHLNKGCKIAVGRHLYCSVLSE